MLFRLILVLLLALTGSPAPAAAACHQPTAAHDMAGHHQPPAEDKATPHACIGCVPPSDSLRARVDGPALAPAMPPVARVATLAIGSGAPPALPPPRIA